MKLTQVRLLVSDMGASYRFYKDVLGLPTTWDENPGYAEFEVGPEAALAIFPRAEMAGAVELRPRDGDGAVVVFSVESVDEAVARLRAQGAYVGEPFDRPDAGPSGDEPLTFQEATRRFQAELLRTTLAETDHSVNEVARRLDLARSHVYNLIKAFGLSTKRKLGS